MRNSIKNVLKTKPRLFNVASTLAPRLKTAVFNWSGTLVDVGSVAPAFAIYETFRFANVPITMQDARKGYTGSSTRDHFKQILNLRHVSQAWYDIYDRLWNSSDLDQLLHMYEVNQSACSSKFTGLIPGALSTVHTLRNNFGMNIGLTTNFSKTVCDKFRQDAESQFLILDACVSSNKNGMHETFKLLNIPVSESHLVIKVNDKCEGLEQFKNSNCWTVGVYATSSYLNVDSFEQLLSLSDIEFGYKCQNSLQKLATFNPDFIIPTVKHVPYVAKKINQLLANGIRPGQSPCQIINLEF